MVGIWYQMQYRHSTWMIVNIVLTNPAGRNLVSGLHIHRLNCSLQTLYAFSLSGKSAFQYFWLTLAWMLFLFSVVSAIAAARTPQLRFRWLWIPYILCGAGLAMMNWATGNPTSLDLLCLGNLAPGTVAVDVANVGFPVATFWQDTYSPLVILIRFPLGAVHFWLVRQRMVANALAGL
jgi:hypothetical protein